ncbi:hypothetical protein [Chitiniphilus shinanonensis]|nr:hypothetical protein [Chitiniphilus shinanonensis]
MMRLGRWLLPLMLVLGACAQAGPDRAVTLFGTLLLKGNAPHIQQVLQTDDAQYQLSKVPSEQAAALQRQRVKVTGVLVREAQPPRLPLVEVSRIEAAQ